MFAVCEAALAGLFVFAFWWMPMIALLTALSTDPVSGLSLIRQFATSANLLLFRVGLWAFTGSGVIFLALGLLDSLLSGRLAPFLIGLRQILLLVLRPIMLLLYALFLIN